MLPKVYFFSVFVFLFFSYSLTYSWRGRFVGFFSSFLVLMTYPFLFLALEGLQGDIVHYEVWYNNLATVDKLLASVYLWKGDFLFFLIIIFSNLINLSYVEFISLQAFLKSVIIIVALYFSVKGLTPKYKSRMYILITFFIISEPYFHFFMGNVLRQGFGAFLLFLFLALFSQGYNKSAVVFFLGSFFSHKSSVVGLAVLFKRIDKKSLFFIFVSFVSLIYILINTSWFSKVGSYANQGFNVGSLAKKIYLAIHVIAFIFLLAKSVFFRGVNLKGFNAQKILLHYLYICLMAISILSLSLSPFSINLHYRFFGEFVFLFAILIGARLSIAKINRVSLAIGGASSLVGYFVVLTNPSVINVYMGL